MDFKQIFKPKNWFKPKPDELFMRVKNNGATNEPISTEIVPNSFKANQYYLADWQKAVAAATAEDPIFETLYDLYDNVMIDLHVSTLMEARILPVQRAAFKIMNKASKKTNDDLTTILDANWFEDFIEYAIQSRFYGHSLIELTQLKELDNSPYITLIPRQNVNPLKKLIYLERGDSDENAYSYIDVLSPFYIPVGKDDHLGFLFKITPVVLAKKYALATWDEFNEKMIIPFRSIKTPSRDKKRHQLLGEILKNMGSAGWAVLNDSEMIELTEMSNENAYKAFDTLIQRLEDSLTRYILGQTATTKQDTTGTYGSLQILNDIAQNRHETDKTFIRRLVQNELIPRLILFGHNYTGHKIVWDNTIELTANEKIDLINKVNQNYYVAPAYVKQELGIPVSEKQQQNEGVGVNANAQKKKFIINFPTILQHDSCCGIIHNISVNNDKLTDLENQLFHESFDGKLDKFSPEYFKWLNQQYQKGLNKVFGDRTGIAYDAYDHTLFTMLEANIYRFSAAKDVATVLKLNELARKSESYNDFKTQAESYLKEYNRSYLKTEYNNVIASGQNARNYQQQLADIELFPYWIYKTQGDNRVRDSHAKLHNMIFRADDPAFDTIYPPNGYNDRCEVEQLDELPKEAKLSTEQDAIDALNSTYETATKTALDLMKKNGFAVNRGKLQVAFVESQMYVKNFDESKLGIKDMYGHERYKFANLDKTKLPELKYTLNDNEAAKKYLEKQKNKKGEIVFTDYNDRPIQLTDKTIEAHLKDTDKYKDRYQYVESIPDILAKPHEVWLEKQNEGSYTFNFIRFTKSGIITVITKIERGELVNIRTFFKIKESAEKSYRQGILIKAYK